MKNCDNCECVCSGNCLKTPEVTIGDMPGEIFYKGKRYLHESVVPDSLKEAAEILTNLNGWRPIEEYKREMGVVDLWFVSNPTRHPLLKDINPFETRVYSGWLDEDGIWRKSNGFYLETMSYQKVTHFREMPEGPK